MRMVRAWRELAVRRAIPQATLAAIDMSKAEIVLPAIKKGTHPTAKILADAQQLGARDLRDLYTPQPATVMEDEDDDLSTSHVGAVTDEEPLSAAETPVEGTEGEIDQEAAEDVEDGSAGPDDAVRTYSGEVLLQANRDWLALETELRQAAASGQSHPRVKAVVITVGLRGKQIAFVPRRRADGDDH
jgi:hypothetical protein